MANILIIDDDAYLTRLLKEHLSARGCAVTVAHSGNDGMVQAMKAAPDVILLDVILPDVTGFQMCSRFRKTAATQATPILMMTGFARFPNQRVFALERGANEYLLKPLNLLEVGELVQRYAGSKTAPLPQAKTNP